MSSNRVENERKLRTSLKTYELLRKSGKRCDWSLLPKDIIILLFDKYILNANDFLALKLTCRSFFRASKQTWVEKFSNTFDFNQYVKLF